MEGQTNQEMLSSLADENQGACGKKTESEENY